MSQQYDLNLLRVLLTLLEEQSVSRAAEKLFLTQSAVSKQLAKLRQQLNDPLFVRHAGGLSPTPRVRSLEPKLRQWLQSANDMIEAEGFEPSSSQRNFRCCLNETCFTTLLPRFFGKLMQQAPGLKLDTHRLDSYSIDGLIKGEFDLAIIARDNDERAPSTFQTRQIPEQLQTVELFTEDHVCLVRNNHPVLQKPWNLQLYLAQAHVNCECEVGDRWLLHSVLADQGLHIENSTLTADFFAASLLCKSSDLVFTCTRSFATEVMDTHQLTMLPLPVVMAPFSYLLAWPQHLEHDQAHRWLRQFIIEHCSKTTEPVNPD
ncbi:MULTISPECIES: LysR family transcriptional regulator [unclassified Agarivorans]|uniref:LysR family transcriptional regulator n=1 Tax=unclassified Agarivorans TaxID=2636026 RepID=UPI0026E2B51F|nr:MULTISPECIES: LysR family transcriptional regulator [unclassified Agarivorans]MDO6687874.1 LysR family transcriptional regulator [Agarivorans sp. 3_MG-2023]MDO6717496.1 LysR family transcriptional regulator [Agarivorans sp. 2_MG-2023]